MGSFGRIVGGARPVGHRAGTDPWPRRARIRCTCHRGSRRRRSARSAGSSAPGSGSRRPVARLIPGQNAAGGIEHLQEAVILEIDDVDSYSAGAVPALLTVVRTYCPSGETCDMKPTRFSSNCRSCERVPRDHVLAADRHARLDVDQRVEALVVLRPVHVHAHGLAVERKGMAIGAGGHVGQHHAAARFGDVAQSPTGSAEWHPAPAA